MAKNALPPPGPITRTKGAEAIAYRAAMVVVTMEELFLRPPPGQGLPLHVRNAFLQSALVDLRSLIGFRLADADDIVPKRVGGYREMRTYPSDVKPSWYMPAGDPWVPSHGSATSSALRLLRPGRHALGPCGDQVSFASWPVADRRVGENLAAFLDELKEAAPKEAKRFIDPEHPLPLPIEAHSQRATGSTQSIGRRRPCGGRVSSFERSSDGQRHRRPVRRRCLGRTQGWAG